MSDSVVWVMVAVSGALAAVGTYRACLTRAWPFMVTNLIHATGTGLAAGAVLNGMPTLIPGATLLAVHGYLLWLWVAEDARAFAEVAAVAAYPTSSCAENDMWLHEWNTDIEDLAERLTPMLADWCEERLRKRCAAGLGDDHTPVPAISATVMLMQAMQARLVVELVQERGIER